MNIYVAKSAGFCGGVSGAVNKALALAETYPRVYTLGELVHNELVTEYLSERGVIALPESQWHTLKSGDVALIRAHGIPVEIEQELLARGVQLHDATCKIHNIVDERHNAGDFVYLVGDKNHDEVKGTFSYARGNGKIINSLEEVENHEKSTSIVFQTTILAEEYQKFCDFVANLQKNSDKTFGIFDTICYTTKARQDETRALAEEYDAVIVLGSKNSANTRRLFQVAKEVNENVFFVENPSQLNQIRNKEFYSISIVAGASTPPWLIQEVTKLMSETLNNTVEVKEEATLQMQANAAETGAEKELTMEDIVKSDRAMGYANYKKGKKYDGIVLNADENGIYVGMQIGKKDGFIDKADAEVDGTYDPANYKKGDLFWNNRLQLDYGFVYASSKPILQKSDDRIYLESKFGYKNEKMKNFSLTVKHCREKVSAERLKGFVMAPWRHTVPHFRQSLISAVDIAAGVIGKNVQ